MHTLAASGISDEDLTQLFIPFNRFNTHNTTERTGTGLVISRYLMQLMNGSLDASSAVGKGSCFTLTLPLTD